ncbi:hypothetical protein OG217_37295 (plasmid) [Streptomyces sp. NBC_01023]|uniref:hypothetical protein n=1 Tax=unclassified Streptomyces TaxID=2593676 RepID=UPI0030E51EEE|nr:hypothetical protein OG217_37295 [Streptomyces sp. NBC_01023]
MSESEFEYRQARIEQAASCAVPNDLVRYLHRVAMDTHSLRIGLAEAVTQMFAGIAAPDEPSAGLPYPADDVEAALVEDMMGSTKQVLVADPDVAVALRHSMRLLEDAALGANLVRASLKRSDGSAARDRLAMVENQRLAST